MYVNDVLALERNIKEAVDRQVEDDNVARSPEVAGLLSEIALSTDVRLARMTERSHRLGGGAGTVKEAVAAAAGALAGFYGKARKHPVSRVLRDDYTALALGATAYSMLYTAAVALHSGHVAAAAQRNLRDLTPLIMQLSRLIPEAVASELAADFPNVNPEAAAAGCQATLRAWSQEHEAAA